MVEMDIETQQDEEYEKERCALEHLCAGLIVPGGLIPASMRFISNHLLNQNLLPHYLGNPLPLERIDGPRSSAGCSRVTTHSPHPFVLPHLPIDPSLSQSKKILHKSHQLIRH